MRLTTGGDATFLHGLQQRRLGLGRGAVDLIGEHDVCKDRPADKPERALPGGVILLEDVTAGDIGRHQVGRKLDARKAQR